MLNPWILGASLPRTPNMCRLRCSTLQSGRIHVRSLAARHLHYSMFLKTIRELFKQTHTQQCKASFTTRSSRCDFSNETWTCNLNEIQQLLPGTVGCRDAECATRLAPHAPVFASGCRHLQLCGTCFDSTTDSTTIPCQDVTTFASSCTVCVSRFSCVRLKASVVRTSAGMWRDEDPDTVLSRKMTDILRHRAMRFGLQMGPDGLP